MWDVRWRSWEDEDEVRKRILLYDEERGIRNMSVHRAVFLAMYQYYVRSMAENPIFLGLHFYDPGVRVSCIN